MTLLDTLLANSLDLTTASACLYSTAQTVDEDSAVTTTVVSAASTILDSIEVPQIQITREMNSYVETMSDEELLRGLELLEKKESNLQTIEPSTKIEAKILTMGPKQQ